MGAREGVAVQAGMPGLGKEGKDYVSFLRTHEGKPGMFQTIFKFHTCVLKLLKRMKITATSSSQSFLRTPWRDDKSEIGFSCPGFDSFYLFQTLTISPLAYTHVTLEHKIRLNII